MNHLRALGTVGVRLAVPSQFPCVAQELLFFRCGLARPPVSLKRIRPGWVMFSQETALKIFCDESIIRELESNFVVERPFVPSLRVESQRKGAVRDLPFRWVALDL